MYFQEKKSVRTTATNNLLNNIKDKFQIKTCHRYKESLLYNIKPKASRNCSGMKECESINKYTADGQVHTMLTCITAFCVIYLEFRQLLTKLYVYLPIFEML